MNSIWEQNAGLTTTCFFNPIHQDIFLLLKATQISAQLVHSVWCLAWTQLPSSSQASLRDAAPPYLVESVAQSLDGYLLVNFHDPGKSPEILMETYGK